MSYQKSLIALSLTALLGACTTVNYTPAPALNAYNQPLETASNAVQKQQLSDAQANELFDANFMEMVMASPMYQTYLGIKQDQDKWDEISVAANERQLAMAKRQLAKLQSIDPSNLSAQTQLSYQLMTTQLAKQIEDYQWIDYNYPVNQMFGIHSQAPSLLINQHRITDVTDAKAYINRLDTLDTLFEQLIADLGRKADKGILAPKFVFAHVMSDSENIITGAPFSQGKDSTLLADFRGKVNKLEINESEKVALIEQAKAALINSVQPAYQNLIAYMGELEQRADTRDGVWKLPRGEAFYNNALAKTTTTDMTAEEIHQVGLSEVARIHNEMRAIMKQVGFQGDLQQFFAFMRDDQQFYLADSEAGRQAYLDLAEGYINTMSDRLDEVFRIKPKAGLIVKAVEPFREKSAGKAFYNQPSMDGSRPGIYYANLYDMKAMPTYQAEALAYHEGLPGHHMQLAISQELEGIPSFRRFGRYTAYVEGWGLYTEFFPKEMGLYQDPYSDFGRLAMELWRACRLVVDTGIHAKQWTRAEGIAYYTKNTPNAESDAVKMVERHIVMPSQATAYKVGMLKILELREHAKQQLGNKFDIRDFHTLLLENGPVPLDVLTDQVYAWIAEVKAS